MEGPIEGHLVQLLCSSRVTLSQLSATTTRWFSTISKVRGLGNSLANLYQCSVTLRHSVSSCSFCFSVYPLPPILSLGVTGNSQVLFLHSPFSSLCTLKIFPEASFLQAEEPNSLSLSLLKRHYRPFVVFVALGSSLSNMLISFLYWRVQRWTLQSRHGLTMVEKRRRISCLNLLVIQHFILQ